MIGLDTNILRYLTQDNAPQFNKASQLIEANQCFIANIVLCEMVWVLRGNPYKYRKDEILKMLELMLKSSRFEFENRAVVYQALSAY